MNNATITLITPVHIGNGKHIQGNAEYLHFAETSEIAIVEETKILDVIGVDQLPIWIDYIENPDASFIEYLQKRNPTIQAAQVAKRILNLKGTIRPKLANTLREQIHTGMGVAYIPGSSIKGALRTVFFADMMFAVHEENGIETKLLKNQRKTYQYKDQQLSQYAFGKDPNHDWFRLLQISDFHFKTQTEATFSETLNEKGRDQEYELKDSIKQLIEYIPANTVSEQGQFKLNKTLQNRSKQWKYVKDNPLFNQKGSSITIKELTEKVNAHTLRLVENEIEFFTDAILPEAGDILLAELERIKGLFDHLASNECLFRLGFGTGFRTMTGDWARTILTDDQYDDLSDAIRGKKYVDYPLPKSRKVVLGGVPLGFAKLTIN